MNETLKHQQLKYVIAFVLYITIEMVFSQSNDILSKKVEEQEAIINSLKITELVQSMSQRSLLMPSYQSELKALVAKQAYDFWEASDETYVSHMNIYLALYYANKFLNDKNNQTPFNQVMGHTESVVSIQFGNDPNIFYSAGSDGRVIKWNISQQNVVPEIVYEGPHLIRSIDVSHDGKWILVVTKDKGVVLVGLESIHSESRSISFDKEPAQSAIFLPNELKYLTVNKDGELKIKGYAVESPQIGKAQSKVNSITIQPDNNDIFMGLEEGQVVIFGKAGIDQIESDDHYAINALAISSDQKLLIIGRELGDAIIWDIQDKKIIRTISGHQSAVTDVDFHPTLDVVLTASRDGTVKIWDIYDPKILPIVLDDHLSWVLAASFDPTGKQIISGSADNYIRFWPLNPSVLAETICDLITRNLTREEWEEYVGPSIPYKKTCE